MQKLLGTRWTTVRFKKICTISPFISYKGNLSLRFLLSSSLLHNSYIRPRALFMPHPLRHFIHPYRLHQTERSRLTYLKIFLTSLERFYVYCYIIAHVQVIHSSRIVQCQHELHKIDFFLYKMIKRHLLSWIWYCLFFCIGCSVARICTILQFCILCEQHPCSICMRSKTLLSLCNDFRLHDYLLLLCDYKMHIIFIIAQS